MTLPTPYIQPVVLASTSPWRLQLLRSTGLAVEGVDHAVDEEAIQLADPRELAVARALAKARDVQARLVGEGRLGGALVVGADQVAWLQGEAVEGEPHGDPDGPSRVEIFGKPPSPEAWRERLRCLRGRVHTLSTGVALVGGPPASPGGPPRQEAFCVDSRVRFRGDLSDEELDAYVACGEARGCAGGYMVEGRGAWLIEEVEGDWNNVVGLPVFELLGRLRARGVHLGDVLGGAGRGDDGPGGQAPSGARSPS